jgi:hypothetical protein
LSANSNLLQGTGSIGFATTASLLAVSSSQQQISSSLLTLTASYTALSSSYIALSASYNTFSGSASTRVTQIESVYATTGSNSFRANQSITGSLVVSSTITAQTLVVQTVTSSIVYSSGSNLFGSALGDRQTFTGSLNITGSTTLNGGLTGTSASFSSEVTVGANLVLSAANPYVYGGTSVGGVGISNITGGSYIRVYGASHATLANNTQFVNAGSTSLTIASSGAATFYNGVTAPSLNVAGAGYWPSKIITLTGAEPSRYSGNIGLNIVNGSTIAMSFGTRNDNVNYDNTLNVINGLVGIGTTNPQAKFQVFGGNMIIGQDGTYALISGPTTGGGIQIGSNSATFDRNLHLGLVTAGLSFSPVLTVNAQTGNLGIGATDPQYKTQITNTSANAVTNILALHNGSNASGTGTGARLLFKLANFETSAEIRKYASIEAVSTADYNEAIDLVFKTKSSNSDPATRMTIGSTGTVTIGGAVNISGITSVGELRIGDVYTNNWTTDATWSSSQIVVPNGVLTSLATYMIEFDWNFNGIGSAPYLSSAATIFRTNAYVNSAGDNNEVALATSSHVGGNYTIYMAMRAAGGSTQAGVSARFSWTPGGSGGVLTVRVKRIN